VGVRVTVEEGITVTEGLGVNEGIIFVPWGVKPARYRSPLEQDALNMQIINPTIQSMRFVFMAIQKLRFQKSA
jgi:hypothetical protein